MRHFSFRPPEQSAPGDDPSAFCARAITSVRQKADRNERMARLATITIILTSALIPVSLIISSQAGAFAWGKLVPSLLAATAATVAGFIQFERPHERWKLYRGYQRAFEAELFRYENNVAPYDAEEPKRTRLFAAAIATTQGRLHDDWSGLVPASAQVAARAVPAPSEGAHDG
jgi:Protein of unknown function (DUF4231)